MTQYEYEEAYQRMKADEIAAEKKMVERFKELVAELADECEYMWRWGDGEGGYVLQAIREAFLGFTPAIHNPSTPLPSRKIPAATRQMVFERDAYRCVKCESYIKLCIDHIHPFSRGGSNEPDNLQTLCWDCNSKKGNNVEVVQ